MPGQIFQTRFIAKAVALSVRRPRTFFALFLVLTLFFAAWLPKLGFRSSIYDLAVKSLPETKAYEAFKKEFGSEEVILVVVRGPNVFDEKLFSFVDRVSREFSELPGVHRVFGLPSIEREMDVTNKYSRADFEHIIEPAELFWKNFLSDDKTATVVSLVMKNDADQEQVITRVEEILEKETPQGVRAYAIGMPVVARALATYTESDFRVLPALAFAVILLMLWLLFGGLRAMAVPSAAVVMTLAWTLGLMAATGTALSLMTMIVPVLLIAVGTAYCMHVMASYRSAAQVAASPQEAAYLGLSRMGFPSTLAVATTCVGLASLLLNRIQGIREFAVFSVLGMVFLLLIILFFLPAVLTLFPVAPERSMGPPFVRRALNRVISAIIFLALRRQKTVFIALGLACVILALGATRIRVETNPVDYFKKNTEVSRRFYDIFKDMAGSFPVNIVIASPMDSYFEEPEHLAKLEAAGKAMAAFPGVDKSIGFTDFLKLVNYASENYDPAFYALPEASYQVRMLTNTYKSLLGADMYEGFMNPEMNRANIMLRTHISSSRDFFRLQEQIEEHLGKTLGKDLSFQVTGLGMVIAKSSHVLTASQIKSLSLTLAVIFGIMMLLFLSGRVGLAAILVNSFPILVCFGVMGLFGIELSVVTSLIASIAIGLAVDDTIHYLVRYNKEFRRDLDKDRALEDTLRAIGPPVIFTTLAISAGFAVLLFSNFSPTAVFGLLMVFTMIAALVGDLLLLPAIMLHIELITAWDVLSLVPSIGGVSAGMAHELRQPLNTIKLGAQYLSLLAEQGKPVDPAELLQAAAGIESEVDRAAAHIDRLASLGTAPSGSPEQVNINDPVSDTLAIVTKPFALDNIIVKTELAPDLPLILGHRNRIAQVVYNLMQNAREAVLKKGGSELREEVRTVTVSSYMRSGRVCFSVEDHGMGIGPAIADRVMEPFFTTKPHGLGHGLGLAVAREIVRDYKGLIRFESEPCLWTLFYVCFPPAPGQGLPDDGKDAGGEE